MNSTFTALRSIERARPYFGGRTEDFEFLETTARGLAHHMDTVPRYQHGFGVVHGDLHEFNVLVSANRINFIDFDLCGYAPRAYDLASFVWGRLFVSKDDVATMSTHFDAMIEGYRKEIDFPDSEKDRVAACLVFREIFRIGLDCDGPAAWGYRWLTAESWNNSLLFLRNWVKEHPYLFAHA
jgi:Ser/Thr protein kinase RdoA (MazF antagonist)